MILCIQEVTIKLIQKFMGKRVSYMLCVPDAKHYVQAMAWAMILKSLFQTNISLNCELKLLHIPDSSRSPLPHYTPFHYNL